MSDADAWGEKYELTETIDLTGLAQTSIGNDTTPFTGTFDGTGNTGVANKFTNSANYGNIEVSSSNYADTALMRGFKHRSVQGGLFLKLLFD